MFVLLKEEARTTFRFTPSQGCLHRKPLRKMEMVSPQWRTGFFAVQHTDGSQSNSIWGKGRAGLLAAHYKNLRFPKLRVPQHMQYHLGPAPHSCRKFEGNRFVKFILPAKP